MKTPGGDLYRSWFTACSHDVGGGQSGSTISTSSSAPWAGAQPFISYGLQQAQNQYQSGSPTYFPGSTVVPLSNQTEQALGGIEQRALAGSPVNAAASQNLTDTLSGKFLDPTTNPAFQKGAQGIQAQLGGMFSSAGRYGSGAMANQGREALTDLAAKTYATERANQMQGLGLAPQIANQDYYDMAQLGQVGAAREQKAGAELQDQIRRWNYGQNIPQQKLAQYMAMIQGGNVGNQTTATNPIYSNPLATGLGAATSLASIYSMLK